MVIYLVSKRLTLSFSFFLAYQRPSQINRNDSAINITHWNGTLAITWNSTTWFSVLAKLKFFEVDIEKYRSDSKDYIRDKFDYSRNVRIIVFLPQPIINFFWVNLFMTVASCIEVYWYWHLFSFHLDFNVSLTFGGYFYVYEN